MENFTLTYKAIKSASIAINHAKPYYSHVQIIGDGRDITIAATDTLQLFTATEWMQDSEYYDGLMWLYPDTLQAIASNKFDTAHFERVNDVTWTVRMHTKKSNTEETLEICENTNPHPSKTLKDHYYNFRNSDSPDKPDMIMRIDSKFIENAAKISKLYKRGYMDIKYIDSCFALVLDCWPLYGYVAMPMRKQ